MDNLTHSLFGYAMARAGADRWSRGATVTLVIAANLPDGEGFFQPNLGPGSYLIQHRGLSHSFLGIVILAVAFPMVVWLIQGFRRSSPPVYAPPLQLAGLYAASALGLVSHLFLDWINTYGVRLLLPFDGRWFYGDIAYIIDPWIWLLLAAAGAWTARPRLAGHLFWGLVAVATTLVIVRSGRASEAVLVLWLAGVVIVTIGRWRRWGQSPRVALGCLLLVMLYLGGLFLAGRHANALADAALAEAGHPIERSSAFPTPAVPWRWIVVAQGPDDLYRVPVDALSREIGPMESVPRNLDDPRLQAIRSTMPALAFEVFYRYPYVEPGDGWPVWLRDARYSWGEDEGFPDLKVPRAVSER